MWFALITAVLALIRPVMHFRATRNSWQNIPNPPVRYSVERPAGCTGLLPPLWNAGAVARHPEHGYMRVVKTPWRKVRNRSVICCARRIPWLLRYLSAHARQNNLFALRRDGEEIVINNIPRTLGLSCKKDISKRGNQASISANSRSRLKSASILRLSTKGGWNV